MADEQLKKDSGKDLGHRADGRISEIFSVIALDLLA